MRLTPSQVELLAFEIVTLLSNSKDIKADDPDVLVEKLRAAIEEDLKVEDKLNDEVREILSKYDDYMRAKGIPYHEMFKKVKVQLAKERKLIL